MKKRRTEKAWITARIAPPPEDAELFERFEPLSCGSDIGVVVLWRLGASAARTTLCCGNQFGDVNKLVEEAESSEFVKILTYIALGQVTREKHLKGIKHIDLAGIEFPENEESLKEVMNRVETSLLNERNKSNPLDSA